MRLKTVVLTLRVLETLLLCGLVYVFRATSFDNHGQIFLLHLDVKGYITAHADVVELPSTILGYILSQIATLLTPMTAGARLHRSSQLLCLAGILTFMLELVRLIASYDFQVLLYPGLLLVLVDWKLTRAFLAQADEKAQTNLTSPPVSG